MRLHGVMPSCIFFVRSVNRGAQGHVVGTSKELLSMNMITNSILSAWPEDERDRKRAPAGY